MRACLHVLTHFYRFILTSQLGSNLNALRQRLNPSYLYRSQFNFFSVRYLYRIFTGVDFNYLQLLCNFVNSGQEFMSFTALDYPYANCTKSKTFHCMFALL